MKHHLGTYPKYCVDINTRCESCKNMFINMELNNVGLPGINNCFVCDLCLESMYPEELDEIQESLAANA